MSRPRRHSRPATALGQLRRVSPAVVAAAADALSANVLPLLTAGINTTSVFTRATLASAGISCRRVSVCLSVCPSVRPSVCLSKVCVLLKRINVGSRKQRHTIAWGSSFLVLKISAKIKRSHPQRRRQMQVG